MKLVDVVRLHYPDLKIVARARNLRQVMERVDRGVTSAQRATFESALRRDREARQQRQGAEGWH